jgi:hypothetical protein
LLSSDGEPGLRDRKADVAIVYDENDPVATAVTSSLRSAIARSKKFATSAQLFKSDLVVEIVTADLKDLAVEAEWAAVSVVAFTKGRRLYHNVQISGSRKAANLGQEILEELKERLR